MLEIKPRAVTTEQNFPKVPRPLNPATTRAPDPVPASAHSGFLAIPDAKPVPSTNVKVNDMDKPTTVAKKTFHLVANFGSQYTRKSAAPGE